MISFASMPEGSFASLSDASPAQALQLRCFPVFPIVLRRMLRQDCDSDGEEARPSPSKRARSEQRDVRHLLRREVSRKRVGRGVPISQFFT